MERKIKFAARLQGAGSAVIVVLILSIGMQADAWASGRRPVARDDSATVVTGGTVSVLDSGALSVLDNDTDRENDPLIAVLTKDVKRGVLTLNSDGTFVYRHQADSDDNDDEDEFKYRAWDGTRFSREAKVEIRILETDPIPPQIVGQGTVEINEDASLAIPLESLIVEDPDSDFPDDFSLEVNDGENYSHQQNVVTPSADYNGEITVPVRVFDGSSFSNLFALVVDVRPRNDAPFTIGTPPAQEAMESIPFELALANLFDDIDANDTLEFSASGLPSSGSLSIDPVSGILSGTPVDGDGRVKAYDVEVTATDSGGLSASVEFQLTIEPNARPDLQLTAAVVVNPVMIGETAQWSINVENRGPVDLDTGELAAQWTTNGPALLLTAPPFCSVATNNSTSPSVSCPLDGLAAQMVLQIDVQGDQDADGDNTLIAVAISDDPLLENNAAVTGAQVVSLFSEGPTQILDRSGTSIASGDIDGNLEPDLVVSSDETRIHFNSGNRTVAALGASLGPDSGGKQISLLDWNADGLSDIAVSGMTGQDGRIYLNHGGGAFSSSIDLQNIGIGTFADADVADFDQDGFADLVLTGANGTVLLRNDGQSGYSTSSLPANGGIDTFVADINNDGFADIIVVEADDRDVNLMFNLGDGLGFDTRLLQRGSVGSVSAADMNSDGSIDLLLALDGTDLTVPESRVLHQQPDGSFSSGITIGVSALSMMLPGDVDGDAIPDIVAVNQAGVHQVYLGNTDGLFTLAPEQIVSQGMRHGVLIDFNTDDSLDLVLAGSQAGVVEIHANNGIGRLGFGDRVAPVIALNGDASLTIAAGTGFPDPGATATDDIDGDLTAAIVVTGNVNSTVVGTYTLTYTVADRAGNSGSVQRTVNVGVNQGTGGSGGGAVTILFVLILLTLILVQRTRQIESSSANRADSRTSK